MRVAGEWEPVFRRRLCLIAVLLKILNSKNPTQNIEFDSILTEANGKSFMYFGDAGL